MLDWLNYLFAFVCGQNPEHTWAPGGILVPCCQRCLGLYAGAALAAGLHLWLRPRLTSRFLEVHGAFLLLMAPFGWHWLPQGPVLRTLTGLLFGFAVVTYLWLPVASRILQGNGGLGSLAPCERPADFKSAIQQIANLRYTFGLLATLLLVPWLAAQAGGFAAYLLSGLAGLGALALAGLVVLDTVLGLIGLARLTRRLRRAPSAAHAR
jgi:uncharacterized membrane protein